LEAVDLVEGMMVVGAALAEEAPEAVALAVETQAEGERAVGTGVGGKVGAEDLVEGMLGDAAEPEEEVGQVLATAVQGGEGHTTRSRQRIACCVLPGSRSHQNM
jgi:hypothetical protein